jgi:hypothetical protein
MCARWEWVVRVVRHVVHGLWKGPMIERNCRNGVGLRHNTLCLLCLEIIKNFDDTSQFRGRLRSMALLLQLVCTLQAANFKTPAHK